MTRLKPSSATRGKTPVNSGKPMAKAQLEALAAELYAVVVRALTLYGLPIARQRQLLRETFKSTRVNNVSGPLLEQFRNLSDLLTAWLEDLPYIDATGRPRILPIKGRGATFESLARQFLPERPLEEVIALACQTSSVGVLSGGRIAVYGDAMVKCVMSPEATLAQTIAHVIQIISTSQVNMDIARGDPILGRFERLVCHMINPEQFHVFKTALRPQLNDLCERADRLLKAHASKNSRKKRDTVNGGLGVYVFYDDLGKKPPRPTAAARTRARS